MRGSLFLSGAMLLIYPFARSPLAIGAATIVLAILTEAFRPAAMAFIGEVVAPANRKSAFAVYRLAINLGMAIGPAIGGILATLSFRYLFFADGATSIAAGLVLAAAALPGRRREGDRGRRERRRRRPACGSPRRRIWTPDFSSSWRPSCR